MGDAGIQPSYAATRARYADAGGSDAVVRELDARVKCIDAGIRWHDAGIRWHDAGARAADAGPRNPDAVIGSGDARAGSGYGGVLRNDGGTGHQNGISRASKAQFTAGSGASLIKAASSRDTQRGFGSRAVIN